MSDGTGGDGTPAPVVPVPPPAGPTAEQIQAWQAQAAEAEALRAKLTAAEAGAKAWERHQAEQAAALKSRTDAWLAGLPEAARAPLAGLDPAAVDAVMRMQQAMAPIVAPVVPAAPVPAAPVEPPKFPAGGAAPVPGVSPLDLTHAEKAWVEQSRPDLAGVDARVVKKFYAAFSGVKPGGVNG